MVMMCFLSFLGGIVRWLVGSYLFREKRTVGVVIGEGAVALIILMVIAAAEAEMTLVEAIVYGLCFSAGQLLLTRLRLKKQ